MLDKDIFMRFSHGESKKQNKTKTPDTGNKLVADRRWVAGLGIGYRGLSYILSRNNNDTV